MADKPVKPVKKVSKKSAPKAAPKPAKSSDEQRKAARPSWIDAKLAPSGKRRVFMRVDNGRPTGQEQIKLDALDSVVVSEGYVEEGRHGRTTKIVTLKSGPTTLHLDLTDAVALSAIL